MLKAPAAMKMALGENPKLTYNERHETPSTRMATAAVIRENLAKAGGVPGEAGAGGPG